MMIKFLGWADKKLGLKKFQVHFRVEGKQFTRRFNVRTEREVGQKVDAIIAALYNRNHDGIAWRDLFAQYSQAKRHLSTIGRVSGSVDALVERIGNKSIELTTRDDFFKWLLGIREKTSDGTADKYRRELMAVVKWGRKQGLVKSIPFEYIPTLTDPAEAKQPRRYVPFDDLPKYFDACRGPLRFFIEFLSASGVRSGAVCGLDEVDLSATEIRMREKGRVVRKLLRDPVLDSIIAKAIEYKRSIGSDSPAVFVRESGQRWQPSHVSQRFKVAQQKAGLEIFVPHELRHTMGTAAGQLGKSPDQIKALLGHASRQTSEIYTHTEEAIAKDIRGEVYSRFMGVFLQQNLQHKPVVTKNAIASDSTATHIEVTLPDGSKKLINKELLDK